MPPQVKVPKEAIVDKAFELTREYGFEKVTARMLAGELNCSTQPIFRNFDNMEDLIGQTFEKSLLFFDSFYEKFDKGSHIPFVNLGLCYIAFAQKESNMFSFLFINCPKNDYNLYSKLNGRTGAVKNEMNLAREEGVSNPEAIFMKMWMLIHGAACMSITNDYDLSPAETRIHLEEAYKAFVR